MPVNIDFLSKNKEKKPERRQGKCHRCEQWAEITKTAWLDPYTDTTDLAFLCDRCLVDTQERKTSLGPLLDSRKADFSQIRPVPKPIKKAKRGRP